MPRPPFTRVIPLASLSPSSPLSEAPTASFADRGNPHVNRNGAEFAGLERYSPGAHDGLGETGAGLQAMPSEEFVQVQIVARVRDRGGDTGNGHT
jgi:hypothetical protein